jgi:hypothetical protein
VLKGSDQETAAADYLFREALAACDKKAERRFATLFGSGATVKTIRSSAGTRTSPRLAAAPVAKHVQAKLKFGPVPIAVQRALIEAAEKTIKVSSPKEK